MASKDVQPSIWSDPWFLALDSDAKLLYLWMLTSTHSHLSGLFVVASEVMCFENSLSDLEATVRPIEAAGKVRYSRPTGGVWVVGMAKRVRSKTKQMAKSIYAAWEHFPDPEIKIEFADKYRDGWFVPHLDPEPHMSFTRTSPEPHPNLNFSHKQAKNLNLTRTSCEVPSQGHSQGQVKELDKDSSLGLIGLSFEELRTRYPIVGNVDRAQEAYFDLVRTDPELIPEIKLGLDRWMSSVEWANLIAAENVDKIPRLATWLTSRRWEENPPQTLRVIEPPKADLEPAPEGTTEKLLDELRKVADETNFDLWLADLKAAGVRDRLLVLTAPTRSIGWINARYLTLCGRIAHRLGFAGVELCDAEVYEAVKAA